MQHEPGGSAERDARGALALGGIGIELDERDAIVGWDERAEQATGVTRSRAVGASFVATCIAEPSRGAARSALERAHRSRAAVEVELALLTAQGRTLPFVWRFTREQDDARLFGVGWDLSRLRQLDALLAGQRRLLGMLARDESLEAVLDELMRVIESQSSGMLCSILRFEAMTQKLHHAGSVSLPAGYSQRIDGLVIGPDVGSCGTAAFRRARVVVEDIASDPLWASYRELAKQHGLRACWSQPVFSSKGTLLGTFATYYREPRGPSVLELELIERAADLAGIALERHATLLEQARLRQKMLAAQKLESLGLLAGGIAHDFNNLLVGILGNAQLAQAQVAPDSPLAKDVDEIVNSGWRAAELCRQLLTFAGRGKPASKPIDWNGAVLQALRTLEGTLGAAVKLELELAETRPAIESDPSQVQQVIVNLVKNAAEAIGPAGGSIHVATRLERAPSEDRAWAVLEVRDTGPGMDARTLECAFDPFFTTKPSGHGLGLAVVQGIVRGAGGDITITSTPMLGTTIVVRMPACVRAPTDASDANAANEFRGRGLVLVVDDEPAVRSVNRRALESLGFDVLVAESGAEALAHFAAARGALAAVLLDLRMPGLDGEQVLAELRRQDPRLLIVVSSGQGTEEALRAANDPRVRFLSKPYSMAELAEVLQELRCG